MAHKINIEELYNLSKDFPVVDVRSPKEFETGHFPGAINIPIFNNEERAIIGTIYKQVSRNNAILKGLEIVGPKLKDFAKTAQKLAVKNTIIVYCWRGGMRSANMALLFETIGLKTYVVSGGYKAFRRHGKSKLSASKNLIILGGLTGSGKTEILLKVKEFGEQVVDLEGLANHKGSVFGSLGQETQPTNEQFENKLIYEWLGLNISKPIWLEDESHSIGTNWIPNELFLQMRQSLVLKIELDKQFRIDRLVDEYAGFDPKFIEMCVLKIAKKLGGQNVKKALDLFENGHIKEAADIALSYYDKSYSFGLEQRTTNSIFPVKLDSNNVEDSAKILIEFAKKHLDSFSTDQN